jgi:outer membrane protein OmpA-like peptidoglycan-associated protein
MIMSSRSSHPFVPAVSILVGTLLLGACGSNPAFQQAAASYDSAMQDPAVVSGAPHELQHARELLDSAKEAQASGADGAEVTHRAYLASQEVANARETAKLRRAIDAAREASANRPQPGPTVLAMGNVFFRTNQAALAPSAQPRLDKLAGYLQAHPDQMVRIEGYTDSQGSDEYNLDLSQRRADAIRTALVSRGVDQSRITAHGNGKASPVADNGTAEGRQMNRRVEVVMSNAGAGQPLSGGTAAAPASSPGGAPSR